MHKLFQVALVLITLVSLGVAIQAQLKLRDARQVVADDLSGNLSGDVPPAAVALPVAATDDVARVEALQRQVAALQAERDKLQAELTAVQAMLAERAKNVANPSSAPAGTNVSRHVSFEDRMAQLKHDDPARYEEMQKQRDDFRQRLQNQADSRAEFLKNIDTAAMTEEQRANHEKLAQTVEQARALMAQIATMAPADAAAARQQMGDALGSVSELYQKERRYLLEQTGRALGYQQETEVSQFVDYVQQIYDQTSMPRGFGRGNAQRAAAGTGTTPAGEVAR